MSQLIFFPNRQRPMHKCREDGADQWSEEKYPYLRERFAAEQYGGGEAPRGVDGGARQWDADEVDEGERQPDDNARKRRSLFAGRYAQNGQHKHEGKNNFHRQCTAERQPQAAGRGKAVLPQSVCGRKQAAGRNHKFQQGRPGKCAEYLRRHIANEILRAELFRQKHRQRNRRIHMTARNGPDGISRRHNRQTKCQRNRSYAQVSAGDSAGKSAADDCRPAAKENQSKCADEF